MVDIFWGEIFVIIEIITSSLMEYLSIFMNKI